MRDLCGAYNHGPVALAVGIADEVLYVAVLHRLGLVPALALGESRLLDRFFYASHVYLGMCENVIREFLVQKRSSFFHCLLSVEHERKFFVFDGLFENGERLRRCDFILCHDRSDVIAVEQRMIGHDQAVGYVLMMRVR